MKSGPLKLTVQFIQAFAFADQNLPGSDGAGKVPALFARRIFYFFPRSSARFAGRFFFFFFLPSPCLEPVSEPKRKVWSIYSSLMIDYRTQPKSVKQLEFDWVRLKNCSIFLSSLDFDWQKFLFRWVRLLNPIEINPTTRVRLSPLRNRLENTGTCIEAINSKKSVSNQGVTYSIQYSIQFDFNSNSHKH